MVELSDVLGSTSAASNSLQYPSPAAVKWGDHSRPFLPSFLPHLPSCRVTAGPQCTPVATPWQALITWLPAPSEIGTRSDNSLVGGADSGFIASVCVSSQVVLSWDGLVSNRVRNVRRFKGICGCFVCTYWAQRVNELSEIVGSWL